jgi:hypothetical protein
MPGGNNEMNTDRMSCGEVREKLPLYVGGDLDAGVLDAVRGHLDLCGECARLAGKVMGARRELVAAFRAQESDVARPGLWPGIRATLHAEGLIHAAGEPAQQPVAPRARRARWTWALAPLAAAAVLLLLVQIAGEFGTDSKVLPGRRGPRAIPAPDVADVGAMPVSLPLGGTLQRISADEAGAGTLPPPYRGPRGNVGRGPAVGGASLAGYKRIK